jgi:hypothetical protein
MSKKPTNTNKNDKRKKYGLPSGSLPVRAKSLFNFLPNQPANTECTLPSTDENLRLYGRTLEGYNSPHSSLDNDNDDDDDDAQTVITDYASNPYGLTTPLPAPNDELDVDDYEPPATELKTYEGKDMYHIINGELIPVTSASYNRDMPVYDFNRKIIPRKEHLPEKRLRENNNIMDDIITDDINEEKKIGGKRRRKPHRKTKRKTIRKKTRRNKRRHTKKYK